MYVNISIHDYLRALMGFHNFNTTFTLDPRVTINDPGREALSRGLGNQVTVEFNLLYRFHCAISSEDEKWTEELIREDYGEYVVGKDKVGKDKEAEIAKWDPKTMSLRDF